MEQEPQIEDASLDGDDKSTRERSTIAFPYLDLDDAIDVAKAIHENGGDSGTISQLAAWLSHSTVDSGGFRMKMATARLFGLITSDRKRVQITDVGRRIIDPATERDARARAFLSVPLFKKMFDKYDGYPLPSDTGLESVFVNLGVAEKQKARARQVFQRSALQAGYFENGKGRLVAPHVRESEPHERIQGPIEHIKPDEDQQPNLVPDKKHELIAALYKTIPDKGAPWDAESREKWLSTAKSIFDLIYHD